MQKVALIASVLVTLLVAGGLASPCAHAQDSETEQDDAASEPSEAAQPAAPPTDPVASPTEAAETEAAPDDGPSDGGGDMADYGAQIRERQELATIHRAFGIATWGAMLATVVLGTIQYHNLYGGFGSREDTPCVQGTAVFGQDQCWSTPYPHAIAAGATTVLYTATFALSLTMPDPNHAADGNGDFANRLSIHKILRWVHFGGMIAQALLGILTASALEFGLFDRANDYDALAAMATVHQGVGWVTFGALSAAAGLMIF